MKHSINHSLPLDTVRTVTKKALQAYESKLSDYEPAANWLSDDKVEISFVALKKKVEGSIELFPERIDLEVEVPFMLKPFQGKAMEVIEKEISKWLGKAEKGELEEEE